MRTHPLGGWINLASFSLLIAIFIISLSSEAAAAAGPVACAGSRAPVTPLGSHHATALPKLDKIAPPNSGVRAVRSGAWSDATTWGGKTPSGRVVIPAGIGVVFDLKNSPTLTSVRVEGCLELSNRVSSRLNTEFLYVAPKGELLAGTPASPVPASVVSEIVFADRGPLNVSVDPTLVGKGLVAASRVRLYGSLKTPRVKVATAPKKGDTVVRLSQTPKGWRVGDRLVLTGTRFIPQVAKSTVVLSSPTEDEIRYIKAISGSTVTLDAPLAFNHASPDSRLGAWLLNYTRNIRLATLNGATLPKTQRAHAMFMSSETTIEAVEFFEMGRTDKSKRAFDAAAITTTPTSNVKGRYPLHLHQSGFTADNQAPIVRGAAIWGSPGWGVGHHAGNAFLFQNNTWNTFGAGFVSESGNETGAWVENAAIKAIGVDHIVKDGADVQAFDLARTGDGFWLQSRSVRLHKNLAVGMTGGMGYVFFHRNNDLRSQQPLTPAFVRNSLCMPGTMRFKNQAIDKPQIAQFTDNEAIASEVGFHIVKPSPIEPHDVRSMIDNFSAWEVVKGVDLTYTSRYTVKDSLLIGSAQYGITGVVFGMNTYDLALVRSKIANFDIGVNLLKATTRIFGPNNRYTVAGVTFSNVKNQYLNRDASDQILTTVPAVKPASIAFAWGAGPAIPAPTALYLYITGVKTDSSGQTRYPIATKEFLVNWTNFKNMTAERGWLNLTTGGRAMVVPEFYSDRLTGEISQTSFIARPKSNFSWPSKLLDGSPADQGKLDPKAAPPTANNDSAYVSANGAVKIAALANDRTNDGKLLPSGFTYARNGNVEQLANGDFEYRPYPDFRGTDSFSYWVRNRQGKVSRAKVSVTVR